MSVATSVISPLNSKLQGSSKEDQIANHRLGKRRSPIKMTMARSRESMVGCQCQQWHGLAKGLISVICLPPRPWLKEDSIMKRSKHILMNITPLEFRSHARWENKQFTWSIQSKHKAVSVFNSLLLLLRFPVRMLPWQRWSSWAVISGMLWELCSYCAAMTSPRALSTIPQTQGVSGLMRISPLVWFWCLSSIRYTAFLPTATSGGCVSSGWTWTSQYTVWCQVGKLTGGICNWRSGWCLRQWS